MEKGRQEGIFEGEKQKSQSIAKQLLKSHSFNPRVDWSNYWVK